MTSSYSLGLFFIFLVAVIWSVASIVVQYLYTDQHFDSPFLLTYIGTSLFVLLLVSRLAYERRHKLCLLCVGASDDQQEGTDVIPWRTDHSYQHVPTSLSESASLEHVQIDFTEKEQPPDHHGSSLQPEHESISTTSIWSHVQHIQVAIRIAPMWFFANWAYNGSLAYTSITSSTVLASTGSLFTFLFAVLCGDERFTLYKLMGVLLGVTGSILTGLHDIGNSSAEGAEYATNATLNDDAAALVNPSTLGVAGPSGTPHHIPIASADAAFTGHAIWGDALGLLSAVGYGAYAVMIRAKCPRDERKMSMQLLLGYIGLFNAIMLSPVALYVLLKPSLFPPRENESNGNSSSVGLTWLVFGYLVAKGSLDNVLSDYLWARAVVLTSATVATVGLGLTIPLAFISDWIMGHDNVMSAQSILGALSVLAGFVLVNLGEKEESQDDMAPSPVASANVAATFTSDRVTAASVSSASASSVIAVTNSNQTR